MIVLLLLFVTQVDITTTLAAKYRNQPMTIGDPFEISVTITHPLGVEVSEPFMDSIGPFMLLDQANRTITEKGVVRSIHDIKLTVFDTGELDLPQFRIIHTSGNTIDTIASNVVPITIKSTLPDDMTDIHDIKKAIEFPDFLPLIIAGIVLAGALLAFFAYRIIRRILRTRTAEAPHLPPWIEALAAIDTIPVKEWLAQRWIKRYYYALSEILKRYIERRFAFNAAEQTTSEIITTMKVKKLPLRNEFHDFFLRADMVKYAKTVPPDPELLAAIQAAKNLVNQTTPHDKEPQ